MSIALLEYAVDWFYYSGLPVTEYDVDWRDVSGNWHSLYNGLGSSTEFRGIENRTTPIRIRRCNGTSCGPFVQSSAPGRDCSESPM